MGLAVFEGVNTGNGAGAAALDPGYGQSDDSRQVAPLARAGALVSLAGMFLGVLGILLPHPDSFDVPAMLLVQAFTGVFALSFLLFSDRVPMWLVRLTPAIGILLVTAGLWFTHDPTSGFSLFYLWPCFYAFYFLPRIDAVVDVAFMGLCFGVTLVVMGVASDAVEAASGTLSYQFVVTFGSLAMAGFMIHALRTRVNRLWGSLSSAARTDLLTGYVNGHGINEILTNEIERARINAHRVGLITVNLVGLRQLNKELGYEAGDEVLRRLTRMLDESTRQIDTVGRTGASEFVVVLPETDEHTTFLLAEQILTRMRRTYRERGFNLSAGVGVAAFPKHASNVDELLQASTAAMKAADALGSDRAVVYSADIESAIEGEGVSVPGEGRAQLGTVLSLAEVLDIRDERGAVHSQAVAGYCEMIGRELGLPEQRLARLRLAGMLHDIGKVGIPDSILDKPGPLSPSEWDQVRRHPEMAARILAARELTDIREWVLARHEQPDGHGYPRGLSGREIPLESRILAVSESYDAMTSDRPYRPARTPAEAVDEIGRYSGTQFDGAAVDALVRALDRAAAGATA